MRAAVITRQALKSWPDWSRTSVASPRSRRGGPCRQSSRPSEPPPGPEPGTFRIQGGCATDCAKEAGCARPDLNRDSPRGPPAPRAGASTYFRHERMRAATRGRTGPPAVRERGRIRARRRGWGTRARTWTLLGQNQMCCLITPFPIEYAGRDLNPQTARFELASFAGLALPARAPPEARTPFPGLRVRCITRHACGAQEPYRGVEPR
jgi:hypothetical protein